jgi:hypothetical protein
MFRAQHVYPTAPGEQEYRYSFTPYNVPSFVGTLLAGARKENIPLPLDADAPFILRAMQAHESPYGLAMRFRDPWRNYLSDDANPTLEDLNYAPNDALWTIFGAELVAVDAEIWCPKGAVLWVDLYNASLSTVSLAALEIVFAGVKRYAV